MSNTYETGLEQSRIGPIEIGLQILPKLDGYTTVRLLNRTRGAVKVVWFRDLAPNTLTSPVLEDIIAAVGLSITELFSTTRGVQLILHD